MAIFGGKMLKGERCTINGDGNQTRDYVFVADVADASAGPSTEARASS